MSKHETVTVTMQTIGALQFMVAFALRGGRFAIPPRIYLTSLYPGRREVRPRTSTPLTYTIIFKIDQGSVLQSGTVRTGCMFTQGFVPETSPWVGTSSAQSSAEGMRTAGTTLFLTESAIFVDRFVPTQECLPLYFATGVQQTSFYLLHAPLYSRCTGVCICTTCALR